MSQRELRSLSNNIILQERRRSERSKTTSEPRGKQVGEFRETEELKLKVEQLNDEILTLRQEAEKLKWKSFTINRNQYFQEHHPL